MLDARPHCCPRDPQVSKGRLVFWSLEKGQRKRKGTEVGKSRSSQRRRRSASTTSSMATVAEPIELEESGEEVVDLTCESLEPVVVDLTHNDSVVIVEEHLGGRRRNNTRSTTQAASCILSSDDEDARDNDPIVSRRSRDPPPTSHNSPRTSGSVSCPICMDGYSEITQSGRLIVSTKCGHIFCSQCLRDALRNVTSCPTCRKKLTPKQYHPIYI
ncbi:E3 ubiquitin-protein ligase RNF4 isoform X3 [Hyla sarda]|uniref:E3 ubiquitin-protein ligase RNF4 isoform X3 n=1 Tax=Hyla sarda TaxID=327740 RepID=UPI0024C36AE6|nr:E3 ubiquitin-protein ligase RNF4 isoform X3 [Hyla sarda]